jgi:hypothetical protein
MNSRNTNSVGVLLCKGTTVKVITISAYIIKYRHIPQAQVPHLIHQLSYHSSVMSRMTMKICDHGFFGSQYIPGSTLVQAVISDKEWKIMISNILK